MVLRAVFASFFGAVLLSGSASMAAEYRPEEFLRLDLSKAVLSPKPLGPPAEFAPVAVEARGEAKSEAKGEAKRDRISDDAAHVVTAEPKVVPHHRRVATAARVETPKGATHRKLAHRRGNPLDAQALDTRIQVWPCRTGGICNWKQ
jgi:hypothetical protein